MRGNRGKGWESQLNHMHRQYREDRLAVVLQAHPEVRVVNGKALRSKGPPDYFAQVGGLGGVLFDAKTHRGPTWGFRGLADHQAKDLDAWRDRGGISGIVLRLGGAGYWVDWAVLGPIWWDWREKTGDRASLDREWLLCYAEAMEGADWLGALKASVER